MSKEIAELRAKLLALDQKIVIPANEQSVREAGQRAPTDIIVYPWYD
ncbi:hypothetical protein LCGC14_2620780 [marine sediment metagenome]|uniref:Uncharacterized protein n=1 Tax=marine sediment metagenome TaxID=412755 RepID=A0A0F9A3C6_9ZZZZ